MKVFMTADSVGGVWTYALELGRALSARGVEVTLATMGAELRPHQRRELREAGLAGAYAADFALEWMDDPWEDVEAAGRWLLEIAGRVDPDVVHLNGYVHAQLPWPAPTLVVAHSCVSSWFAAVRGTEPPPAYDRYRREVRAGLAAAGAVAAPTAAMLCSLRRFYDVGSPRYVIPNGRRLDPPAVPKEPFVLAAGRFWDEAKNLAILERVAPGLPWPIRVAGPLGERRPRTVEALGVLSAAGLACELARASVYAAPALYEPFGFGPLEAGLCGCALVLGDIPSLREVWGDEAALYVDPRDDDALAAALALLADDEALRRRLGAAARERAACYTPEKLAGRTLEVYEVLGAEREAAEVAAA